MWTAEELVYAYLDFVKQKQPRDVNVKYYSERNGYREAMEGRLEIGDQGLGELPEKIKGFWKHELELRPEWDVEFTLMIDKEEEHEVCELWCHESLRDEVMEHFKHFKPNVVG